MQSIWIPISLAAAFLLTSSLMACKSSQTPTTPDEVSWQVLDEGPYCGIEESISQLITNQREWEALYETFGSNRFPAPEAPEIDFESRYVIACFMGSRTSGGHSVGIQSIKRVEESLQVKLIYTSPGLNCTVTEALTQPYVFATVSKQNVSTAEFEVANRIHHCK